MNKSKENLCRKSSLPDKGGTEGGFEDSELSLPSPLDILLKTLYTPKSCNPYI